MTMTNTCSILAAPYAKDKLGDSFGTTPYLSTGHVKTAELSQNCTGKQTDLNTVLKSR
jgi:hypothetical protein